MTIYEIALFIFLMAHGISVFVPERVIVVVSGIAAIVAAILLLVR